MMKKAKKNRPESPTPKTPFPYIERPEPKAPFLREDINLQSLFNSLQSEMTLQQNKRDQIIAFYLTATSLISTFVFSNDIYPLIRAIVFFIAFLIGHFWSTVILRYRIYKESYWIALRTVSCLFSEDRSKIDKGLIQHLFYKCMLKNFKDNIDPKNRTINEGKIRKSIRSSAEYLMYLTFVLLTSLAFGMTVFMLCFAAKWSLWLSAPICLVATLGYFFLGSRKYSGALAHFYDVLVDGEDSSFNRSYKKAWQLHMFS